MKMLSYLLLDLYVFLQLFYNFAIFSAIYHYCYFVNYSLGRYDELKTAVHNIEIESCIFASCGIPFFCIAVIHSMALPLVKHCYKANLCFAFNCQSSKIFLLFTSHIFPTKVWKHTKTTFWYLSLSGDGGINIRQSYPSWLLMYIYLFNSSIC